MHCRAELSGALVIFSHDYSRVSLLLDFITAHCILFGVVNILSLDVESMPPYSQK